MASFGWMAFVNELTEKDVHSSNCKTHLKPTLKNTLKRFVNFEWLTDELILVMNLSNNLLNLASIYVKFNRDLFTLCAFLRNPHNKLKFKTIFCAKASDLKRYKKSI